ncbi:MAG: Hsp20 family protein [Candidatus Bathyarchaeia archaeon]|jgi:HSP20 family molecular chaperone IbpA
MSIRKRQSISDIIDEYFEDMEKWAEQVRETLSERPCWDLKTCAIEPLREITVTPTEVIVTVDLPYAKKETVQVKVVNATSLEIFAEMKKKIRLTELGVTHRKGVIQRFHGWIRIPVTVNIDKMRVQNKKGILEIKLPRKR